MKEFKFSEVRNQFIAVACANLMSIAHGGLEGWLAPALLVLQSDESPIGIISTENASWIASVTFLGLFVGGLLIKPIIARVGRKATFLIIAVPNFIFWLTVIFANKIEYLIVGRILGGIVGGCMFVATPLFVTEIADDHVRGMLGSMLMISGSIGVLFAYVTGFYMSYRSSPLVMMIFPIATFVAFLIIPDTPMSLTWRKKPLAVEKSLKFYLNCHDTTSAVNKARHENALEYIELMTKLDKSKETLSWRDFVEKRALIGFGKSITLVFLSIFCGSIVLLNFASLIFQESGSPMDPKLSSIIMIINQFISSVISTALVDKVGRRPLLIISSIGSAFGMGMMGVYNYLSHKNVNLEGLDWIPVASISFAVFSTYIGLIPLVFVVLVEVLPPKVRDEYATVCLSLVGLLMFLVLKLYTIAEEHFEMFTCMWFFTIVSIFGAIFGLFVLEETKGKNINV